MVSVKTSRIDSSSYDLSSFEYELSHINDKIRLTDYSYKQQRDAGIPPEETQCYDEGKLVTQSDGSITCVTEKVVSVGVRPGVFMYYGGNYMACGPGFQHYLDDRSNANLPPVEIEGFEAEPNHDYSLDILRTLAVDVRTDEPSYHYSLIEIQSDDKYVIGTITEQNFYSTLTVLIIVSIAIIMIVVIIRWIKNNIFLNQNNLESCIGHYLIRNLTNFIQPGFLRFYQHQICMKILMII